MQRICKVLRSGGAGPVFGNRYLLGVEKNEILLKRYKFQSRLFGSQASNEGSGGGDDDKASDKKGSGSRKVQKKPGGASKGDEAKAKLRSLLSSIVEDSKKAAATASTTPSPKTGAVNMRLARPEKVKEVKVEVPKTEEEKETEKDLGKEMVEAVKKVAESVRPEDPQAVESELVQKLKTQVGKKVNFSDLFAGMKIDRTPRKETTTTTSAVDVDLSRARRVRRLLDERSRGPRPDQTQTSPPEARQPRQRRTFPQTHAKPTYVPIDLFGAPPLGIFVTSGAESKKELTTTLQTPKLETWDALYARDLKLSVTHPPSNGFEEMIQWTEQKKLWKFPIDNEQGLDEESTVPFHEHVFLEPQIEPWCPKKGPIRHFMELVCIGLSKNPYITVKEKHKQIEWYHQYFKKKGELIKGTGAGEIK